MEGIFNRWRDSFVPGQVTFNSLKVTEASEQLLLNSCHTMNTYTTENPITHGVFEKFKFADIYTGATKDMEYELGSIKLFGDGSKKQRYIANLFT